MFDTKPQEQHRWLERFTGKWVVESECAMSPDQAPAKTTGNYVGKTLGGLWLVGEGEAKSPEGGDWKSIITLGFDPTTNKFVGTFIASMMTHLWHYSGTLDAAKKKLVLDTTGPKCQEPGMANYQDVIEIVDDNNWLLWSQMQNDDGKWQKIMTAHHRRA